jgi:hypothetical protein
MNWRVRAGLGLVRVADRLLPRLGRAPLRLGDPAVLDRFLRTLHPVVGETPIVRVGGEGDGGYLMPDDFDGIEACFSPGVGPTSEFELDCANRGIEVFLADRSVSRPAQHHERFHFSPKHIGSFDEDATMTLDHWVSNALPRGDGDLLLQMDIEGSEYEVIHSTSQELLARCRVVVAEFHDLDLLHFRQTFPLVSRAFEKLLRSHVCVHIHPNNYSPIVSYRGIEIPKVAEFTFVRRDRVRQTGFARQFPHPLDADNGHRDAVVLPKSLYFSEG